MKSSLLFRFWQIPLCLLLLSLTACSENKSIVNNVDERDANEIIVYLSSKGIAAQKMSASTGEGVGGGATNLWNIAVSPEDSVKAISYLNEVGLPRRKGITLLDLFAKQGLMTTDKEETIRYQAGLEEQLKNTIRKMDGVLDTDVQISFPKTDENAPPGTPKPIVKAAVYIKHQGVFDDPNNHLETKVKRLIAGSIDGLTFENVSVISDRARFSDISLDKMPQSLSSKPYGGNYVSIWSIVMTKDTAGRFRAIFFIFIFLVLVFAAALGFIIYKFYPIWQKIRAERHAPPSSEENPPPSEEG